MTFDTRFVYRRLEGSDFEILLHLDGRTIAFTVPTAERLLRELEEALQLLAVTEGRARPSPDAMVLPVPGLDAGDARELRACVDVIARDYEAKHEGRLVSPLVRALQLLAKGMQGHL